MKKKVIWLPIIMIFFGLLILFFTGWQVFRSFLSSDQISLTTESDKESNGENTAIFSQLTTQGGIAPEFNEEGTAIFYKDMKDNLSKIQIDKMVSKTQELLELPLLSTIKWNLEAKSALIEWQLSPEGGTALGIIDTSNFRLNLLIENAWGSDWVSENELIYLSSENMKIGLWKMNKNGSNSKNITFLENIEAPQYVAWSPQGSRLVIQGAIGTKVYFYKDDIVIEGAWIDRAHEPSWSPDGWLLSFRKKGDETDTLWVANLDGGEQRQVYEGVFSQVNWLPDGRLVFFTPAKGGGAACWTLDPLSGTMELLADSSIVIYKPVDHIAVSPKGDALAFQAQDQQIWLLSFSE